MAKEYIIGVSDAGELTFIYADELAFLLELGDAKIKRASHVEPAPDGGWEADMRPVGGHVLGPFALRQTALDSEVEYLEQNII
jgi:hypothetical protein